MSLCLLYKFVLSRLDFQAEVKQLIEESRSHDIRGMNTIKKIIDAQLKGRWLLCQAVPNFQIHSFSQFCSFQ